MSFVPFSREIRPDSNIREISPKTESGKLSCFNFNHNLLTSWWFKAICAKCSPWTDSYYSTYSTFNILTLLFVCLHVSNWLIDWLIDWLTDSPRNVSVHSWKPCLWRYWQVSSTPHRMKPESWRGPAAGDAGFLGVLKISSSTSRPSSSSSSSFRGRFRLSMCVSKCDSSEWLCSVGGWCSVLLLSLAASADRRTDWLTDCLWTRKNAGLGFRSDWLIWRQWAGPSLV